MNFNTSFIKCCFCSGIRVGYANHFRPIISQRIFRFSPHISRFFCFASKIGNPLIFASTIFRYLARDTILQDPSSLHQYCEKCFSVAGSIALGNLSEVDLLAAQNNNYTNAYFEEVLLKFSEHVILLFLSINPKNDIVI